MNELAKRQTSRCETCDWYTSNGKCSISVKGQTQPLLAPKTELKKPHRRNKKVSVKPSKKTSLIPDPKIINKRYRHNKALQYNEKNFIECSECIKNKKCCYSQENLKDELAYLKVLSKVSSRGVIPWLYVNNTKMSVLGFVLIFVTCLTFFLLTDSTIIRMGAIGLFVILSSMILVLNNFTIQKRQERIRILRSKLRLPNEIYNEQLYKEKSPKKVVRKNKEFAEVYETLGHILDAECMDKLKTAKHAKNL